MSVSLSDPIINQATPTTGVMTALPAPPATPINQPTVSVPAPAPVDTSTPVRHHIAKPWRIVVLVLAAVGGVYLLRKL
jgi:hypothetical protein